MIATHRRHHGSAPGSGRHDCPAHGVPNVHERQWPAGIRRHASDVSPLRPDGREIVADAAALLHRDGRLLQHLEDASHAVRDRAHHETVEERHRPVGARACHDSPGRQEPEVLERRVEPVLPHPRFRFAPRERTRNSSPCVLDGTVDGSSVCRLEAVFHVPDLFSNGRGETGHDDSPWAEWQPTTS